MCPLVPLLLAANVMGCCVCFDRCCLQDNIKHAVTEAPFPWATLIGCLFEDMLLLLLMCV